MNDKRMIAAGKRFRRGNLTDEEIVQYRIERVNTDKIERNCPVCGRPYTHYPGFESATCHRGRCRDMFARGHHPETWATNQKQNGPVWIEPSATEGE